MVYITRIEHFNAAHRLFNPKWTREENEAVFGKCANENWHGHNFDLFVTVKGEPDPETGFVINAHELSSILKKEVVEKLDHDIQMLAVKREMACVAAAAGDGSIGCDRDITAERIDHPA